jgi:hypothetical protein
MSDYTVTYSPDDNKLRLYAGGRLPADLYAKVRAAGYIWAPKQQLFVAPKWTPAREDLALELAGQIDDEDRSLIDRAEDRADRFDTYREHRTRDAEHARAAVSAIADNIPFGQPILVGHHSERHARRDAERIENGMRRAVRMWDTAQYWKDRAAGAIRHAKYKELPRVRANRIRTIEAERRKHARDSASAAEWITRWGKLNAPRRGEELRPGVFAQDGAPADDAIRLKRAIYMANYDHLSVYGPEHGPYGTSIWSALTDGKMTPREAQIIALRVHARTIANARRWIAHLDNRLTYERAMLDEQGATYLLAPKPKSAKALLPLCNYRAPGGLQVQNMYNPGELIFHPQIEMTSAEYAAIHADYKGTRIVDHSHRVRTMQRSSLVCVFLTDAKVHERPAPQAPPEPPRRAPIEAQS